MVQSDTAPPGPTPGMPSTTVSQPWLVLAAVGIGVVMQTSDSGGVNVSLHTLARTFDVTTATVSWLLQVTFLVVTSTLFLFGRLSDQVGSKNVFVGGFAVHAVGSLIAGFAPSFPILLLARGVQSVGISMLSANSNAILSECFPPAQRGTALGLTSTLVGVGFFLGPLMAGFALQAMGWQLVFLLNVPLDLLGFGACMLVLPRSVTARGKGGSFDIMGAVLFASAAVALLLGLNQGKTMGWTAPIVPALLALAVLIGAAFIWVERRTAQPMVDVGLFSNRLFSLSILCAFLVFVGTASQDFLVPLFVQQVLSLDPASAAAAVATVALVRTLLSSPSGLLSDRLGTRWLSGAGAAVIAAGILGLGTLGRDAPWTALLGLMAVVGAGSGVFFSPNMHAIMSSVPPDRLGTASGAIGVRRNLGQAVGVAISAAILQPGGGQSTAELITSFQLAFLVAALAAAAGAVVGLASGSTRVYRRAPAA